MLTTNMGERAKQLDFWSGLQINAIPDVKILRNGKRTVIEATGEVALEGSARDAAQIIGLDVKTVYRMIKDGEIGAFSPRGDMPHNQGRRDRRGRAIGYKIRVNLKDAFRIRYGQRADQVFEDLGLN